MVKENFSNWLRSNRDTVDLIINQAKKEFEEVKVDGPSHVSVNHLQISSQKAFERGAIWALRFLSSKENTVLKD